MRKSFQSEWQGIRFSEIANTSSRTIAGPEFYQAYYREFFRRYQRWEQLTQNWRQQKERWAEFILSRGHARRKVLSVGCGLGIIEHFMRSRDPQLDLSIHEVAPSAWRWVEADFPEQRKFVGIIPDCLPKGIQFDLIYLAGVDYALNDDAMTQFLTSLRPFLKNGSGECLLISGSFQHSPVTPAEKVAALGRALKDLAAAGMDACGLYDRGQFWGWTRTRAEYCALMKRSGFEAIEDGFIEPDQSNHYWVSGR